MRSDIEILKRLFLPEIEEMYSSSPDLKAVVSNDAFWEYFNKIVFDTKEIANFLNSYRVATADYFISRLEERKNEYVSHLASDYCNGETNPTIELLLKMQFIPFMDEVTFQKDIKKAITISENEKLKRKLSLMDEAASFEITDSEIADAFQLFEKKNEYEGLKKKMNEWDKAEQPAFSKSEHIYFQLSTSDSEHVKESGSEIRKERKTISLSFVKYAVAACFVGVMVWIGVKFYNQPKENFVAANIPDTSEVPRNVAKEPVFALVDGGGYSLTLLKETGIGFAKPNTKPKIEIEVHYHYLSARIASIETYLSSRQKDSSEMKYRLSANKELDSLKKLNTMYVFDGKTLELYTPPLEPHFRNAIISANQRYYFKSGDDYFYLKIVGEPQKFVEVTDKVEKEKLERIYFDNRK